jgi:hypothetical protein
LNKNKLLAVNIPGGAIGTEARLSQRLMAITGAASPIKGTRASALLSRIKEYPIEN